MLNSIAIKTVSECYHSCDFHMNSMDGMYCNHPTLENSSMEEQMIITQDNSRGRVPDKCPLRDGAIRVSKVYTLKEDDIK